MHGKETKLIKFMEGADKRFVIPVYQRHYDWKIEQCQKLYDDLIKVIRLGRKSHFFGSIVSSYRPDSEHEEYQIIDGQQRLTTVSLLLLAMYHLIHQGKVIPEDKSIPVRIFEDYLVDKYQPRETRLKLKSVRNDQQVLEFLLEGQMENFKDSNLTINYEYFYRRIQKEEITLDELFRAVRSLEIINIKLDPEDNPQLIFESLNSTGLDLSEGDKIRNYILMGLPIKQQEEYYAQYWNKIEDATNGAVDLFVRDYLSIKRQSTPAMNKIYPVFKSYVEDQRMDNVLLLQELLQYAKRYKILVTGQISDRILAACIGRLNHLETSITRPFFLEVLRLYEEKSLSMEEMARIFLMIESYLFRRTICDLPTNQLNKIFLLIHKEIIRLDGTAKHYADKLNYVLQTKKERARFPKDEEFAKAFAIKPIYLMNGKNKRYIMERFENYGTVEDKDVYRHFDAGDYSIEHIMPQHITPAWAKCLGNDYEQIHHTWLHRMANLTITGYNANYSNALFREKRDMEHGYRDSGIRMNQWIAAREEWGEKELQERNELVTKRALDIWSMSPITFVPEKEQMDSCTLDDEINVTGRKIARYGYQTLEQPVANWREMFERMVRMLHFADPLVLRRLAHEEAESGELSSYVSSRKEDLRSYIEIDKGLYVESNTSTGTKLTILRRLFARYRLNPSDLIFYLKEEEEEKHVTAIGEYRRRFWFYALNLLKESNRKNGLFTYCNPVSANWISTYFNVPGLLISCVANQDSVRVEICIRKADTEENKQIFDAIYDHKAEIEQALGERLIWDRGEERKSSKVYVKLDDMGIQREENWPVIAKYMAKWSGKLYENVITPYFVANR